MRKDEQSGVITVYLSLVFLLLLAIITTVLESARLQAAKTCIEAASEAAVSSAFAEYYLPLYEEYHVFGLDTGYGTTDADLTILQNRISDYMEFTLYPANENEINSLDLWRININSITVTEDTFMQRDHGVFFRSEAVDYMKYKGVSTVTEQLLSSLSLFKKADDTKDLLQIKASTEEELEEIDACILKLFGAVDGIRTNEKGIKMTWRNQIAIADSFVKMIYIGQPTQEGVGVRNNELFDALKTHYVDPIQKLEVWRYYEETLFMHVKQAGILEDMIKEEEAKDEPDKKLIKEYEKKEKSERKEAKTAAKEAEKQIEELTKLNQICLESINEAIDIMEYIELKQEMAQSSVWNYEDKLLLAVNWLDKDLYEDLNESLNTMKDYIGQSVQGVQTIYDFPAMKLTLEMDKNTIVNINGILDQVENLDDAEDVENIFQVMQQSYESYSFEGLMFDYSDVELDALSSSPLTSFSSFIENGLTGIVIPDSKGVSENELSTQRLPSRLLTEYASEEAYDVSPDAANDIFGMFDEGISLESLGNLLLDKTAVLSEKILFLGYILEHFNCFSTDSEGSGVLQYEQEYILCGNTQDNSNLNSVTMKILLIRALFCMIQVLSDSAKGNEARIFATSILGFTGMPVLISILKFTILFIWAFEEAMVETAAIMQGKKIALMTDKQGFSVSFEELPLMGKTMIQEKAEIKKEDAGPAFGYQEYLMLFLFLQDEEIQNLRSLDLIQENIQAAYSNSFYISNVLFGVNADIEVTIPIMFLNIPFIRKRFAIEKESFTYNIGAGFAY